GRGRTPAAVVVPTWLPPHKARLKSRSPGVTPDPFHGKLAPPTGPVPWAATDFLHTLVNGRAVTRCGRGPPGRATDRRRGRCRTPRGTRRGCARCWRGTPPGCA